ncbi:MAG: DUF4870 domain-containing protein [Planctomycetaceae bacterium]|nr:DUF4870 domain-containing protein [Planctomycetaceae bacterium]
MSNENENNNPDYVESQEIPLSYSASQSGEDKKFWGMNLNTYCMLMHLSLFAGAAVPGAGFILPIVMWAVNKDESPVIDQHGKNIFNFMINMFIYAMVSLILIFAIVGIFTFIATVIAVIVCPIVAAVKANDGKYWPYPLCIWFFK